MHWHSGPWPLEKRCYSLSCQWSVCEDSQSVHWHNTPWWLHNWDSDFSGKTIMVALRFQWNFNENISYTSHEIIMTHMNLLWSQQKFKKIIKQKHRVFSKSYFYSFSAQNTFLFYPVNNQGWICRQVYKHNVNNNGSNNNNKHLLIITFTCYDRHCATYFEVIIQFVIKPDEVNTMIFPSSQMGQ